MAMGDSPSFPGRNLSLVKTHNIRAVLLSLLYHEHVSRVQLAKATSLSTTTISNLVAELLSNGIVAEEGIEAHTGRRRVGRPRTQLRLVPDARYAIGVHIGIGLYRIAVTNLYAETIYNNITYFAISTPPTQVLANIAGTINGAIQAAGIDRSRVVGVGVGASGLVDHAHGINIWAPNLRWKNIPIQEQLNSVLKLPVVIDNNVRVMALGEALFGSGRDTNSLAFVYGRVGVGAGFVFGGQIFRGSNAGAGEIGHSIMMVENGKTCRCGNRGCLETLVSEPIILEHAKQIAAQHPNSDFAHSLNADDETLPIERVFAAARSGDRDIRVMIEDHACYLGLALTNLVNILNPELILLGGMFAQAHDLFIPPALATVRANAFSGLGDQVRIEPTSFGWRAGVIGASALALTSYFYQPPEEIVMLIPRIGLVVLARPTFDLDFATQIVAAFRQRLAQFPIHTYGPVEMIQDQVAAQRASEIFQQDPPDLLLVLQATFADSTLITQIVASIDSPLLLWALPEPHSGGRLRLNSFCGINLAGHALTLRERYYDYIYAAPEDDGAWIKLQVLARAGAVYQRLKQSRLGVVGKHPAGMDTCHLDANALQQIFGLQAESIPLPDLFIRARAVDPAKVAETRYDLDQKLPNLAELEQAPLHGTLQIYHALRELVDEQRFDGLAVRCWPEFFTEFGCAACGAMSMLTDEFIPCSCEADANGTITQLILQWLSGSLAFGTDFVSIDEQADAGIMWHCGLAPLGMADPDVQPRGTVHSNRKVPLIMEFPLKPGEVTLARLSQARGELSLVIAYGTMLAAPPAFSGTTGTLRFNAPIRQVVDSIMHHGLEHHLSLTYGDFRAELQALATMLGLPVLNLTA